MVQREHSVSLTLEWKSLKWVEQKELLWAISKIADIMISLQIRGPDSISLTTA